VLTARRECDAGFEVYRLALPAVVGVKEGINLPRYATLPGRLRAKKPRYRPSSLLRREEASKRCSSATPTVEVTETVLLGTGADAAPAVVDLLVELGLA